LDSRLIGKGQASILLDLNWPGPLHWGIRDWKVRGRNKEEGKINALNVESLGTLRENSRLGKRM
jgi:hypothetical protein